MPSHLVLFPHAHARPLDDLYLNRAFPSHISLDFALTRPAVKFNTGELRHFEIAVRLCAEMKDRGSSMKFPTKEELPGMAEYGRLRCRHGFGTPGHTNKILSTQRIDHSRKKERTCKEYR